MTKNQPNGPPPDGYQPGGSYGYPQQPQYGGQYSAQGQGYNQQQQPAYGQASSGQGGYGDSNQGQAQSYYASNDQPYQQYPHDRREGQESTSYYQGPPASNYPPFGQYNQHSQQQQHGQSPPPQQYPAYGRTSPLPPNPPPYGQEYSAQTYGQHSSGDVDAFKSHFDQQQAPAHYGSPPPPGGPAGPGEGDDRGFLGAVAGGAAGAYGGHKMGHHGIIGGIGGAIAGSMLEDAAKKHHKKDKKDKKEKKEKKEKKHKTFGGRRGSSSSSSSSSSSDDDKKHHRRQPSHNPPAGNFAASSHGMHIDGRCTLVAECKDVDGRPRRSQIDLNDCFTNTNGGLFWARGGNFAASSRDIRLTGNGEWLEAELDDGRGKWVHNKVWLSEQITNDNGNLHMLS